MMIATNDISKRKHKDANFMIKKKTNLVEQSHVHRQMTSFKPKEKKKED